MLGHNEVKATHLSKSSAILPTADLTLAIKSSKSLGRHLFSITESELEKQLISTQHAIIKLEMQLSTLSQDHFDASSELTAYKKHFDTWKASYIHHCARLVSVHKLPTSVYYQFVLLAFSEMFAVNPALYFLTSVVMSNADRRSWIKNIKNNAETLTHAYNYFPHSFFFPSTAEKNAKKILSVLVKRIKELKHCLQSGAECIIGDYDQMLSLIASTCEMVEVDDLIDAMTALNQLYDKLHFDDSMLFAPHFTKEQEKASELLSVLMPKCSNAMKNVSAKLSEKRRQYESAMLTIHDEYKKIDNKVDLIRNSLPKKSLFGCPIDTIVRKQAEMKPAMPITTYVEVLGIAYKLEQLMQQFFNQRPGLYVLSRLAGRTEVINHAHSLSRKMECLYEELRGISTKIAEQECLSKSSLTTLTPSMPVATMGIFATASTDSAGVAMVSSASQSSVMTKPVL